MRSLNETKLKLEKLNLKYMDNNNWASILRNYQFLKELEVEKCENE